MDVNQVVLDNKADEEVKVHLDQNQIDLGAIFH